MKNLHKDFVSYRYEAPLRKFAKTLLTISVLICITILTSGIATAQRAIQNPSVENPGFSLNSYHRIAEETLVGWLTTHPLNTCDIGPQACRPIERWSSGFNGVSTASGAGSAFVELNAEAVSMIYQRVCMTQGEQFNFSFLHRGRNSATVADVADFRIGIPSGLPAGSRPADSYSYPILRVSTANDGTPNGQAIPPGGSSSLTTNRSNTSAGNGWRRYGGTYQYNGPTQVVNIGFAAVSTAGGNVTVGNFIDDWQIQLAPYIEAAAVNTYAVEGSNGSSLTPPAGNRPALRISGNVGAGGAQITVNITGGSGVAGTDFSLTEPFQAGNSNGTVIMSIPQGTYDGVTTGIFNIPFSSYANTVIEPNKTIEFAITSVTGSAYLASLSNCGELPLVQFSHTIVDDDTPSSAVVSIGGRVVESNGRGINGVTVALQDQEGRITTALTNQFGYFELYGAKAGEFVILSVSSKRHSFKNGVQTIMVNDSIDDVLFMAN